MQRGTQHSDETKAKLRETWRTKRSHVMSEEQKQKLRDVWEKKRLEKNKEAE